MGISTLSVAVSIFVLSLGLHDLTRAPRWLRSLTFNYLAKAMCMKEGMPEVERGCNKVDDVELENAEPKSKKAVIEAKPKDNLEKLIQLLLKEKTHAEESNVTTNEWKAIAKVLDRLFFWLFFLVVALGTIIFIILMFT